MHFEAAPVHEVLITSFLSLTAPVFHLENEAR